MLTRACTAVVLTTVLSGAVPAAAHTTTDTHSTGTVVQPVTDTARTASPAEVFLVSTLYRRHETVAAYDLDVLRTLITRIEPHVLVLDVTPTELATAVPHGSKVEYSEVIFPLLRQNDYRVYAGEPDEPLFSEIVQPVAARRERLAGSDPDRMAAWRSYDSALHDLLGRIWHGPADVNGALTDRAMQTRQHLEATVFGPADQGAFDRWNGHFASVILHAASENPGRRILVLVGVQNRFWLHDALQSERSVRLVDIETWLRSGAG